MYYDNLEFHNVEELRAIEGQEGLLMQRLPEDIRLRIRERAQMTYIKPASSEIRFVAGDSPVKIKLFNYNDPEKVAVYFGDFQKEEIILQPGLTTLEVKLPERIKQLTSNVKNYKRFNPSVARLIFQGTKGVIHYVGVEGEGFRPPMKSELPSVKYLAYGTSITHGQITTSPVLSYVYQTAWRLGADLINLGTGGSAFCEEAIAEFIASRDDWDFASLCLSVNMLNQGVTAEEFKEAASNFIKTILKKHPNKPIFCIGIFPYYRDYGFDNLAVNSKSTPDEFRKILKQIVEEISLKNVIYIDGRDLLDNFEGLNIDILHPGNLGMIRIGEKLAEVIGKHIPSLL